MSNATEVYDPDFAKAEIVRLSEELIEAKKQIAELNRRLQSEHAMKLAIVKLLQP